MFYKDEVVFNSYKHKENRYNMKKLSHSRKCITALIVVFFTSAATWAQDSMPDIDVEITAFIDEGPFYAQLWFWVVIGIVFLLLLIALIRGGGKKRIEIKEEEKTQEESDTEKKD